MAKERVISALLRFGLDNQALNKVKKGAMSLEESFQDIVKALEAGGDGSTAFGQAALKAFEQVKAGGLNAEQALEDLEKQALENQKAFEALEKSAKLDLRGPLSTQDYDKLSRGLLSVAEAGERLEKQKALDKAAADADRAAKETKAFGASLEQIERRGGSIHQEFARTWQAYRDGAIDAEEATRRLEDQMEALESHHDKIRNFAGYFGDIASTLALTGASIVGPLTLAATSFVDKAGMADATSREWLATTKELERSQMRVGRVAAQAILPVLEKAAAFAEDVADFAEAHPNVVKTALGVGGTLLGAAAIAEATEKGIRIFYDIKSLAATGQQLLAGQLMQKAATQQLAAAGMMQKSSGAGGLLGSLGKGGLALAGSVAGGVALGVGVNEYFAGSRMDLGGLGDILNRGVGGASAILPPGTQQLLQLLGGPGGAQKAGLGQSIGFESLGKYASVGAYGAGSIFGDDTATQWFESVAKWTGQIADDGPAAAKAVEDVGRGVATLANSPKADQILESFISFQQENQQAETEYYQNRQAIIDSFGQQAGERETQYQKQRLKTVEDFEESRSEAEADYAKQRQKIIDDFAKDDLKREKDFQKSRQKVVDDGVKAALTAEADYKKNVAKFLESSNKAEAKAETDYYDRRKKAAADFGREAQRAEAEHQKDMLRLRQDHDRRIMDAIRGQDTAAFLAEQRNHELQRQRAEEDFQDRAGQEGEEFKRRMSEMEEEFRAQKEERKTQRAEQLDEMRAAFEEQKAERKTQRDERLDEMDAEFAEQKDEREADHQERLDEMDTQHQEQMDKEDAQYQERLGEMDARHREEMAKLDQAKQDQLNELDATYQKEKEKRKAAFTDQIRDLDEALLGETETKKKWYAEQAKDLEKFIEQARGGKSNLPGYPGRALGGYVGAGLYNMHDGEFVLNSATTRAAEGTMGGPLSQSSLMAALAGRGLTAGSNTLYYNPTYTFNDRDDRQEIFNYIDQRIDRRLLQTERGF